MSQHLRDFAALLRNKDYALLWVAHFISIIGDWVLTAALLVFVYDLTGGKLTLGKMLIFEAAPVMFFGYPAGALADYLDRRKLMIACDILRAVSVLLLLLVSEPGDMYVVYAAALGIGFFGHFFSTRSCSVHSQHCTARTLGCCELCRHADRGLWNVAWPHDRRSPSLQTYENCVCP